jgi:hypothetical protein
MYVSGTFLEITITQRPPKPAIRSQSPKGNRAGGGAEEGDVGQLIDMCDAPKGLEINVVYNGTLSGLNAAIWDPSFFLPSGSVALRVMPFTTFMLDADIDEMLLNFPMHKSIRPYAGIDIHHFQKSFQGTHLNKLSHILR